jgi:GNAT superfamily N-acetyltransferase
MAVTAARTIRRLVSTEVSAASDVLCQAAAWSAAHHAPLWSTDEVSVEQCLIWAYDNVLFGGFDDAQLAAVFCLHDVDALYWPDSAAGDALYLHKIAVRRNAVGTGWLSDIIAWAEREAVRRHIPRLRLDTLAHSPLVGLYERHGFIRVYDEPLAIGGRVIDRFERKL